MDRYYRYPCHKPVDINPKYVVSISFTTSLNEYEYWEGYDSVCDIRTVEDRYVCFARTEWFDE